VELLFGRDRHSRFLAALKRQVYGPAAIGSPAGGGNGAVLMVAFPRQFWCVAIAVSGDRAVCADPPPAPKHLAAWPVF